MFAKITSGELAGTKFEISEETAKNIMNKKRFKVWKLEVVKNGTVYNIGTEYPDTGMYSGDYNFSPNFKGRGAFLKADIEKIIKELQEIIKD